METQIKIHTFGGFKLQSAEGPITGIGSRKAEALLVYLACNERAVAREVLADLLWDDRTQSQAMGNLRRELTALRQNLGEAMEITRRFAGMNKDAQIWMDVKILETSLALVRQKGGIHSEQVAGQVAHATMELYQGEFLEGFHVYDCRGFEEWQVRERERLHRLVLDGLYELVIFELNLGNFKSGIKHCSRLLELDPLMEAAHRGMMNLLAVTGQRAAALAQFDTFCELLEEELGAKPSLETQETYNRILKGERPPGVPLVQTTQHKQPELIEECPYLGLAAFREEDAQFYYGRESFTDQVFETIKKNSLVAVIVGSSGSGKSSAVFAGLLPRLHKESGWLVADFRPSDHPFHAISMALVRLLENELSETDQLVEAGKMAIALNAGEIHLSSVIGQILKKNAEAERLLLIVDQLEELFTLCWQPEVRRQFLDIVLDAVNATNMIGDQTFVLLGTVRADFMGQILTYRPLADALQKTSILMGPMNREELRAAIEKPAEVQGAAFEVGLVERLLDDVGDEPGNLPLLEFALTLIWERENYGWLTHTAYEEIGKVEGALAKYTDCIYEAMSPEEQAATRKIFIQLVRPGVGTEDTRRIAQRSEIGDQNWSLVQQLADHRLVVTGGSDSGSETVELVHEALMQKWGLFRKWINSDRSFRVWQERLRANLRQWEESGRDEGALLRGVPLAEAEGWREERTEDLSQAELSLIEASITLKENRQIERETRRKRVIGGLVVGFVIALVLAIFAGIQWQRADDASNLAFSRQHAAETAQALESAQRATATVAQGEALFQAATAQAETHARATAQSNAQASERESFARELAAQALNNLEVDPQLSILLALQAVETTYAVDGTVLPEAETVLHRAVSASQLRLSLVDEQADITEPFDVTFSPDGAYLAVSADRYPAKVWDLNQRRALYTLGSDIDTGPLQSLALSPDGAYLATSNKAGSGSTLNQARVQIYGLLTGELVTELCCAYDRARNLGYNMDGRRLVALDLAGITRVWDVESGVVVFERDPQTTNVLDVAISPNGRYVAVSEDANALVFDVDSGEQVLEISGHSAMIRALDFSPDGSRLATASADGTARIWDAASGQQLLSLAGHSDQVTAVAFDPEGERLATSSIDGDAKIWNLKDGEVLLSLAGHSKRINGLAFSPDGRQLATASQDGTVKIWNLQPDQELLSFSSGVVYDMALDPEGIHLATTSGRGTATIWDLYRGQALLTVSDQEYDQPLEAVQYNIYWEETLGLERLLSSLAFSLDGSQLVTSGSNRQANVWDATSGRLISSLDYFRLGQVSAVAISPDGWLIAGAGDGFIVLWERESGEIVSSINAAGGYNFSQLLFSPDSTSLISVDNKNFVIIYGLEDSRLRIHRVLMGRSHVSAAVSPSGDQLATGELDGVIRVWNIGTGEELQVLNGHNKRVNSVAYSQDGVRLVSASADGTAIVWDATSGKRLLTLDMSPVGVGQAAFSHDGKYLITANWDNTIRLHILDLDELITLANQRLRRGFTDAECQKFLRIETCP